MMALPELVRSLTWTAEDDRNFNEARGQVDRLHSANQALDNRIKALSQEIGNSIGGIYHEGQDALARAQGFGTVPYVQDSYQVKTTAPEIRAKIVELRKNLAMLASREVLRANSRLAGMNLTQAADIAYAGGDEETGNSLMNMATDAASVLLGHDKLTDPLKSLVELASGKNIRGEDLKPTDLYRNFVSLAKFLVGLQMAKHGSQLVAEVITNAVKSEAGKFVIGAIQAGGVGAVVVLSTFSMAGDSESARHYQDKWSAPNFSVNDSKLSIMLEGVWERGADLQSGYLPRKVFAERWLQPVLAKKSGGLFTGQPLQTSAVQLSNALQGWLSANPSALKSDRQLATNILSDLRKALAAKPMEAP